MLGEVRCPHTGRRHYRYTGCIRRTGTRLATPVLLSGIESGAKVAGLLTLILGERKRVSAAKEGEGLGESENAVVRAKSAIPANEAVPYTVVK